MTAASTSLEIVHPPVVAVVVPAPPPLPVDS